MQRLFFQRFPVGKNENKNCLNKLKFFKVSQNNLLKISAVYLMRNPQNCQDLQNQGQGDLPLSAFIILET